MSAPLMRCYEARPYLSAYVDGEVDAGLAEHIYEHLAACADCRKTVARYTAVDALIGQLPAPGPSPEVLDHVLAATSSLNKERAVRESLRRPEKPLAPRSLPAFILADTNLAAPVRFREVVSQSRRGRVLARALPAMAALLIITLTLVSFHGRPGQTSTVVQPTPDRSPASEVQLTDQKAIAASAGKLGFVPQLPTTLPTGARFQSVKVAATDTGQKYLDVVWSLDPQLTDMHLREMGVPLVERTDYLVQAPNANLTWQIPGDPQWQNMVDSGDTGRLVVGEDRGQFSITLDIGLKGGDLYLTSSQQAQSAVTDLRLTSLSIDSQYQRLAKAISPPGNSMVVHFTMQTVGVHDGRSYQWDVYWNESTGKSRAALYESTSSGALGTVIYTDFLSGGRVARCTPTNSCAAIPYSSPQVAKDPFTLAPKVQTFLNNINGYVRDGELWNLGVSQTELAGYGIDTTALYALAYVSGPYPITVYVYASNLQVAAVISQINVAGSITPGGKYGQSPLTSLGDCAASYPLLVFLDPHSVNLFPDLQAGNVGNQPSMPTAPTCSH